MSAADELLEYVDQVVVVPRSCEWCFHPAVVYWMATWPFSYMCRRCYDKLELETRHLPWRAGGDQSKTQL